MGLYGRYASATGTTVTGVNLMTALQLLTTLYDTEDDKEPFVIKKMTLICDGAVGFIINGMTNGSSYYSPLFLDVVDSKYKLSFDKGDILISSLVPDANVDYYIAFLY